MTQVNQSTVNVEAGTLVILSGLPGSGKSTLKNSVKGLTHSQLESAWVSTDALRKQILGSVADLDKHGVYERLYESANPVVFEIVRGMVRTRLNAGMTVFLDATNINDTERKGWVELANEAGAPHLVVILGESPEECEARNVLRQKRVPDGVIAELANPSLSENAKLAVAKGQNAQAAEGFSTSSQFNHVVVKSDAVLEVTPRFIKNEAVDVIGDVHGLTEDLLILLGRNGWVVKDGYFFHPQGRKLLFLGDLVDRGPDSLGLLRLVGKSIEKGTAQCVKGNHDLKLARFIAVAQNKTLEDWTSRANALTGVQVMRLSKQEQDWMAQTIRNMPPYLAYHAEVQGRELKLAFLHGDIHRFDPFSTHMEDMVFGESRSRRKVDSDSEYQSRTEEGLNEYVVFRGHIPQTSTQESIFSLERHPFQKGELVLMHLDVFLSALRTGANRQEAFESALSTQKCDFDFEAFGAKQWSLQSGLEGLAAKKMVHRQRDDTGLLTVYKYSKQTFWNNSWGESDWLLKARGIVLDTGGNIVSHPFDKCFNYGENGTGKNIPDSQTVVVVDKLNGFLGIISAHPFKKGELLVHTQGGFGGDFVGFIRSFLTPKVTGLICRYLAKNDVTLMFEVLHKDDPHIVEYPEEMMGLHLLGVRGKNLQDLAWTEEMVDEAGREMELRRPSWSKMTFGEAKELVRTARNEGVMIRDNDDVQTSLLKMKSPFYLVTKFLGRLSSSKIKHMYGNPHNFKQTIDEEFYPIVDAIVSTMDKCEFEALSDEERVNFVRKLINEML